MIIFSLFIESLRQLQTMVDYYYCWRLRQCLPHDLRQYPTFSLFHVSSYLANPGDTDPCWVLGIAEAAICSSTELCLSVCPDALLRTFSSPIAPAVAINWKITLLQLLLKTHWVMMLPVLFVMLLCHFFTGGNCSFDSHNVIHNDNTFL